MERVDCIVLGELGSHNILEFGHARGTEVPYMEHGRSLEIFSPARSKALDNKKNGCILVIFRSLNHKKMLVVSKY